MIVGEAPGEQEVLQREPFVGASGMELNRMLHEAGIMRSECFLTNVCRERPPDNDMDSWISKNKRCPDPTWKDARGKWVHPHVAAGMLLLETEINLVKPNVIIAFGNTALWALTHKWGIKSWRGSLLETFLPGFKVVPAYHPAYILRDWAQRAVTVHDLKRARRESESREINRPEFKFELRPDFNTAIGWLNDLRARLAEAPLTIACDIETRAGHIACLGLATDTLRAICIPFMCLERPDGYWDAESECAIVIALQRVLCHPNARIVGQNFIYDAQYIYRHWKFVPAFARDTMLGHHVCFAGTPKGLDYLSSVYCANHVYWKDEGKLWDPRYVSEDQLWAYNCQDCVRTFEVDQGVQQAVDQLGLREQHDFQQSLFWPVLEAMVRGVRVDQSRRAAFANELRTEIECREEWFRQVLGHPLNPRSPLQMRKLFHEDLAQKPFISRKTGSPSLDDEALQKMAAREPMLRPLVSRITEHRSLNVFLSTFVGARLDNDQRLRCSYNIAGTETFRLSSSTNAFDSGLNLQNIPKGGSTIRDDPSALQLPNVRKLFVPDSGYTFFDCDLDRADLQVVVWEADDDELRSMLLEGVNIHAENAKLLGVGYGVAKSWVHGTNYGASARTMAINCGISVAQAERMRARWLGAHPGIARWHQRVESTLRSKREVRNRFGYRRFYFDRIDGILPEALAWIPQSTVAVVINRIWRLLYEEHPEIQVLLQVHDSLAGQFPTVRLADCRSAIRACGSRVIVPYDRPLNIPLGISTSEESWGDCK